MRIAVDVGGTFTDVIALDSRAGENGADGAAILRLGKVETIPADPARGVLAGFAKVEAPLDEIAFFVHGTTLGVNALLTRTGARVAIVTTQGFRDVYELGRTSRDPMYDFKYRKPASLVPRALVFEVSERMTYDGAELLSLDRESVIQVAHRLRAAQVEAVAVCLLHAYANPQHELEVEEILCAECPEIMVTLAHRLSREYREYERMSTAVLDAYIKPVTHTYLDRLEKMLREQGFGGHFLMTRSGGGAMTIATAKSQPVHLVLSGPAGGVVGARYFSQLTGNRNLITIDLGGTSLDASLVIDHEITVQTEQEFQMLPTMIPTLDITTIGAGGGSIAWIDPGGHLQVGPQSAGASPGPACYAKGGTQATLTDAALVAGYLDADNFLGGELQIDKTRAEKAVEEVAGALQMSVNQAAAGILRISEGKIVGAVREISVERGHHPKDFAMLAFGGGGGLVAAAVARELGVPRVIVPPGPGNFSALGMLMVDVIHDFAQTYVRTLAAADLGALEALYQRMLAEAQAALEADGIAPEARLYLRTAELRYSGQEHTVNVGMAADVLAGEEAGSARLAGVAEAFSRAHEMKYGHRMDDPVEIVTLRVRAIGTLPKPELPRIARGDEDPISAFKGMRAVFRAQSGGAEAQTAEYAIYDRRRLRAQDRVAGPAIIEEPSSTTVLHAGDHLTVGDYGELSISIGQAGRHAASN